MIEMRCKGQVANVTPPRLGSRKSSKVRVILDVEYSDDRWDRLGKLLMNTDVVDIAISGEEIQPELPAFEPQDDMLGLEPEAEEQA